MYRIWITIKKELLLLLNDKVGLLLMFAMPLLLVIVITVTQDSAFKVVNENKISLLIVNKDSSDTGLKLVDMLKHSGMFLCEEDPAIDSSQVEAELLKRKKITALYIPADFTFRIKQKADNISRAMLADMGLADSSSGNAAIQLPALNFLHDPVLQDNYCYSILGYINSGLAVIENAIMIESVYKQLGYKRVPDDLKTKMLSGRIVINQKAASNSVNAKHPDATQHNVPAWTVFAMFFMVVSLGSNIVRERRSGSFVRLKSIPSSYRWVLMSKQIVYVVVSIIQVVLIFSVAYFLFPLINLPRLENPSGFLPLACVVLASGWAAVSYAMMIGSIAQTEEQANGVGAITVIVFAALGGVWVPSFVMPHYLQVIGYFSPLHWCIEGFYNLFLKGGAWHELFNILLLLLLFSTVCQIVTYLKLRIVKLV